MVASGIMGFNSSCPRAAPSDSRLLKPIIPSAHVLTNTCGTAGPYNFIALVYIRGTHLSSPPISICVGKINVGSTVVYCRKGCKVKSKISVHLILLECSVLGNLWIVIASGHNIYQQ